MVAEIATQMSNVMPNSNGLPGVSLCGRTSVMRTNVGLGAGMAQVMLCRVFADECFSCAPQLRSSKPVLHPCTESIATVVSNLVR